MQSVVTNMVHDKLSRNVEPEYIMNVMLDEGYSEHEIEVAFQSWYKCKIHFQRSSTEPYDETPKEKPDTKAGA